MLCFLNEKIPIEIRRKNVKGINITVEWNGKVKVTAPENLDESTIEKVLQKKAQWIEIKFKEIKRHINSHPMPTLFASGETIWLLGKPMTLELQKGEKRVRMKDGKLIIQVEKLEPDVVRTTLVAWLTDVAIKILTEKVKKFSKLVEAKPIKIEVKEWKRKWGLCRTDKKILIFNWRLVQLPENLIDYIVVHELVHLKHIGHGKNFWACMSKIFPNYYQYKEMFKEWTGALLW